MQEPDTNQPITPAPAVTATAPAAAAPVAADNDKTLHLIAFILNVVTTVGIGWTIIPLAWMIPMTVISYGIYKGTKKNTTTFAVCTLLFVNAISGVLLLVTKRED